MEIIDNYFWTGSAQDVPDIGDQDRMNSLINIFKGVEEYILDNTGVIVSSNVEAVTITGFDEWEVMGRHISIFYTEEDQVKLIHESDLKKARDNGSCFSSGIRLKKRGTPFFAKTKIESLVNVDDKVSGFRFTIQDTTHKALYDVNFGLIRDEYLNLFNNPFIGMIKFRITDLKILIVNEKAESIFGKHWSTQYLDSYFIDGTNLQDFLDKIKHAKKIENHEVEMVTYSGSKIWVSFSCKFFEKVGFVEGVILDITTKKEALNKVLTLSNELELFIYHTSHDLRSPITSIYGLINLLKSDQSKNLFNEYITHIEDRLGQLDSILRDIVEIAFNTSVEVQPEIVSLESEFKNLSLFAKNPALIKFEFEVESEQGVRCGTDLFRLRNILKHIVSNSFKYYNPNLRSSFVKVSATIFSKQIIMRIEDNGIGIDNELLKGIPKLFYKANVHYRGKGLGLYIANLMVEKLNGSLKIESSIGKGTVVTIMLPNLI